MGSDREINEQARAAVRLLRDAPDDDVGLARPSRIRCRVCGFECDRFHGWVFCASACRGITEPDGKGGMRLHEWEPVEAGKEVMSDA